MKATFETTYPNSYTSINKIKISDVEKFDFIKLNDPSETLGHYYERATKKPDILINGGLYTLKTGINILSFTDEGVEQNYTTTYDGIGIKSGETIPSFGKASDGGWRDFITAYPVLVKAGSATTRTEWGNAVSIDGSKQRQAIGYNDEYFFIVTVDKPGASFLEMQQHFLNAGAKYAMGLDGGGSTRKLINGVLANNATENRAVDNAFQIFLKDVEEPAFVPGVYKVQVNSYLTVRSDSNTSSTKLGELYNDDTVVVTELSEDEKWGLISYDNRSAYIYMQYVTRIADYEEPEVPLHWAQKYYDRLLEAGVISSAGIWSNFDESAETLTVGHILAALDKLMELTQ